MSSQIPAIGPPTEVDLDLDRSFRASPETVWAYWMQPELLTTWFGPVATHVDPETVVVEPHADGRWDLDMVDDNTGRHYPVRSVLRAVHEPSYFAGVAVEDEPDLDLPEVILQLWVRAEGAGTTIHLKQGPFTREYRDQTGKGWESSFSKLDRLLAEGGGQRYQSGQGR